MLLFTTLRYVNNAMRRESLARGTLQKKPVLRIRKRTLFWLSLRCPKNDFLTEWPQEHFESLLNMMDKVDLKTVFCVGYFVGILPLKFEDQLEMEWMLGWKIMMLNPLPIIAIIAPHKNNKTRLVFSPTQLKKLFYFIYFFTWESNQNWFQFGLLILERRKAPLLRTPFPEFTTKQNKTKNKKRLL